MSFQCIGSRGFLRGHQARDANLAGLTQQSRSRTRATRAAPRSSLPSATERRMRAVVLRRLETIGSGLSSSAPVALALHPFACGSPASLQNPYTAAGATIFFRFPPLTFHMFSSAYRRESVVLLVHGGMT